MPIEIKMPALSPTMEEGTLAKWLVKAGDTVKSGDLMAEIETDKATMEFEAVDEGVIAEIVVPEGTDGVKVGAVIAILAGEGEDASAAPRPRPRQRPKPRSRPRPRRRSEAAASADAPAPAAALPQRPHPQRVGRSRQGEPARAPHRRGEGHRYFGADRLRPQRPDRQGGCRGRQARRRARAGRRRRSAAEAPAPRAAKPAAVPDIPHEAAKLSNIRKTIARRLTESKQRCRTSI